MIRTLSPIPGLRPVLLALGALTAPGFVQPLAAAPIVVETEALEPQQQRQQFRLPPGFEIQLVAAEPDIGQPMNLNFDAYGRLWVSHSVEYPFPARGEGVQPRDLAQDMITDHDPRDRVSVIEGIGADGRAVRIHHFVDGLNIPIGLFPRVTGTGGLDVISYSIPQVSLYRDPTNSGSPALTRVLFTGFGNVDTHGMCSSLNRGFDGWIYACHGFRNTTRIRRPDGGLLEMNSGNTFRFQPDGSAIEQITWGQVNPFGMTFDAWGDLYNADCHSMPVTLLLRGAYYESFGKPHDGMGFGPNMIDHIHGSTGICGIASYDAPQYPAEYRDCLYICNPVNGQVHRDRLEWTGSSPQVATQPEFITCDDGWFRPVDVKLGPDGALYVADFYNSIIGHYEAPLQHPLRDRTRGRIWRIVYRGEGADTGAAANLPPNLAVESNAQLVARLGDPNFAIRVLAMNLLADRAIPDAGSGAINAEGVESVLRRLEPALSADSPGDERLRAHAVWVFDRVARSAQRDTIPLLERLSGDASPLVRNHVARILGDQAPTSEGGREILRKLLRDEHGRVRRSAAQALALQPRDDQLSPLLAALAEADPRDVQFVHALRMCIRNHLALQSDVAEALASADSEMQRRLASIALGVHPAPQPLVDWLQDYAQGALGENVPAGEWESWLRQSARYGDDASCSRLATELRDRMGENYAAHVGALRAIAEGRQTSRRQPLPELTVWGEWLALSLLDEERRLTGWGYRPLPGRAVEDDPFAVQPRSSQDGDAGSEFFSTLPRGEQRTGILSSQPFTLPPRLTFWMAGHDGFPENPPSRKNLVRLVDVETGRVLRQAAPPRNDTAQLVEWDLADSAGRQAVLEIQDADEAGAYAWLAVGRFSLPELNPSQASPGALSIALVRELRLTGLLPALKARALDTEAGSSRAKAALAMLSLQPDARSSAVLPAAADPSVSPELRERILTAVVEREPEPLNAALRELVSLATSQSQLRMAETLASDLAGAEVLAMLAEEGRIAPRILQQPAVALRLKAHQRPELDARIEELTSSLAPQDEQIQALIAARRDGFDAEHADVERGRQAFVKRCAACHQVGAEGHKIGPQLDGIGIRGLERLLEDVLDPNRNVDAAFRSTTFAMSDGLVVTGLKRREEGGDIVLADQEGKEFRIVAADVEDSRLSQLSLMPANFGEQIPVDELNDLLGWLLEQRPAR
ncbi:MAG: HEAT repeat domain-containing protein [Planctomyces sp.]|nr:HEAT repeat domain-containing protein [Planctomyces sp.]